MNENKKKSDFILCFLFLLSKPKELTEEMKLNHKNKTKYVALNWCQRRNTTENQMVCMRVFMSCEWKWCWRALRTRSDWKIKRENNNFGLLLCWHLLCDYLIKRLRWNIFVRTFVHPRVYQWTGERERMCGWRSVWRFSLYEGAVDKGVLAVWGNQFSSGNLELSIETRFESCDGTDSTSPDGEIWVAHCRRVHRVGGKMNCCCARSRIEWTALPLQWVVMLISSIFHTRRTNNLSLVRNARRRIRIIYSWVWRHTHSQLGTIPRLPISDKVRNSILK